MNVPKRRGRRPANIAAPIVEMPATEAAPPEGAPTKRRRRAATGGFHLRLKTPERPGYHRRWFNDEPGRLAEAEDLAYSHVCDPGLKSDSPDTRVRQHVGSKDGRPLYAYLMETPMEEYRAGQADKEEAHTSFEAAIRRGEDHTGRMSNSYGRGSIEERQA